MTICQNMCDKWINIGYNRKRYERVRNGECPKGGGIKRRIRLFLCYNKAVNQGVRQCNAL